MWWQTSRSSSAHSSCPGAPRRCSRRGVPLHSLLPALVLAGAYGASAWLRRLGNAVPSASARRVTGLLACLLAIGMTYTIRPYTAALGPSGTVANVRRASPFFGAAGSVMSVFPSFVLAYTDRPAVNVPI